MGRVRKGSWLSVPKGEDEYHYHRREVNWNRQKLGVGGGVSQVFDH